MSDIGNRHFQVPRDQQPILFRGSITHMQRKRTCRSFGMNESYRCLIQWSYLYSRESSHLEYSLQAMSVWCWTLLRRIEQDGLKRAGDWSRLGKTTVWSQRLPITRSHRLAPIGASSRQYLGWNEPGRWSLDAEATIPTTRICACIYEPRRKKTYVWYG